MLVRLSAALCAAGLFLAGCAYVPAPPAANKLPIYPNRTASQLMLNALPPAERPLAVAVYGFSDQTGQFKPNSLGQTLSRAISQGGSSMLMKSLQEAGQRGWFTIAEREQLKDLLNERQIIRDMRAQYLGEKGVNPQALPSLLFAGVLLEGGIVGYDSNTVTGGAGASTLGIGATTKYQQDTVTVYLRAVSVKTGEVLTSVTAAKTITSYAVDLNVFRYVDSDKLLQAEAGFTTNEPGMMALQQAIDKAVYGLIMEGVDLRLWNFADPAAAALMVDRYHQERDGLLSPQEVARLERRAPHTARPAAPPSAAARTPAPAPTALNQPPPWRPTSTLVAQAQPQPTSIPQPSPAIPPKARIGDVIAGELIAGPHSPAPAPGAAGSTAPQGAARSD